MVFIVPNTSLLIMDHRSSLYQDLTMALYRSSTTLGTSLGGLEFRDQSLRYRDPLELARPKELWKRSQLIWIILMTTSKSHFMNMEEA